MKTREAPPPRQVYLTATEWRRAVYLWETGRDTYQIARAFGCHQSFMHNRLPHYRKVFRGASVKDEAHLHEAS
jgi:hypothetical protein